MLGVVPGGLDGLELLAEVAHIVATQSDDLEDHRLVNQETSQSRYLDAATNDLLGSVYGMISKKKKKRTLRTQKRRQFPPIEESQKFKKQRISDKKVEEGLGCPMLQESKGFQRIRPTWSLTVQSPLTLKLIKV